MDNYILIENLLDKNKLEAVYKFIDNDECEWVCGTESILPLLNDTPLLRKNNIEALLPKYFINHLMVDILSSLGEHDEFSNFTLPSSSTDPIISRTEEGGYYRPHHDSAKSGHYSTTIFLNEPDEYEGGELCLLIDGEVKKYKLSAGSSITYKTGIDHMVAEVTKGHRDVVVFWTKTICKDYYTSEILRELTKVLPLIEDKKPTTLEESSECPTFIIRKLINTIKRENGI